MQQFRKRRRYSRYSRYTRYSPTGDIRYIRFTVYPYTAYPYRMPVQRGRSTTTHHMEYRYRVASQCRVVVSYSLVTFGSLSVTNYHHQHQPRSFTFRVRVASRTCPTTVAAVFEDSFDETSKQSRRAMSIGSTLDGAKQNSSMCIT